MQRLRELKAEHPFWGYRRLWAYLPCVEQRPVNKKRMWRLRREHSLLGPPNRRLKAKRTPGKSTPQPTKPHEWWGIEMTKVLVHGFGGLSIVVVLDGDTKAIVGDHAGSPSTARHWLAALL